MTRPRLALPFTIVPRADAVWLVAGEDVRLTLRVEGAAEWVPALLARCDGAHELADLIERVPAAFAPAARQLLEDLAGERVLVDGGPEDLPALAAPAFAIAGAGRLADALRERLPIRDTPDALQIFAQDDLDLGAALAAMARWRGRGARAMWVSVGALARAYVGPLLLPDAGPCLECLLGQFRLLSPAPDVYPALLEHPGPFAPAPFPARGIAVAAELACWKLALLGTQPVPSALFALHVVEAASLEISSHRVFRDSECPACAGT